MKIRNQAKTCIAAASLGWLAIYPLAHGQETETDDNGDLIELSPFVVDASEDQGYYASQTLAGGRIATDIKNTGVSIEVVTEEFLDDVGANTVQDFLQYTTGGEVGGAQGNIVGASESGQFGVADTSAARRAPHQNTRLRGIGRPDYVRNFYKTNIPMDRYNTNRVDINRGANSFLFGLGSPAGLINSNYEQATMKDSNTVEVQVGTGGSRPSYRGSFNFNKEIIDDVLAVRFAGLHDRTSYRQRPAYKDDDRLYGAVTFKPFRNSTIRAHIERGQIYGNAPDTLLPAQAFDTFIEQRTPVDFFYNMQHFGHEEGPDYQEWLQMSPEDQAKFVYRNGPDGHARGGNLLLNHGDAWGYALVYDGTNGSQPSFGFQPYIAQNKYEKNGDQPGDPYWDPAVLADGTPGGKTDGNATMLFWRNNRYRKELNGIGPAQGFTSLDIFDFSKYNFGGNSDFYSHDFTTWNATFEQLLFDGNAGFEVGIDHENLDNDALTNFNGWKGEFLIDINKTIPLPMLDENGDFLRDENGEVVSMAMPNPNFGRPVYLTEPDRSTSFEERDTVRLTAFAKYDFEEKHADSFLKWLGKHTLTFLADNFTESRRTANTRHQSFSDDFNLPWQVGNSEADRPSSGYRRLTKMVYMGPPIQSYINDPFNPATPIKISDIIIQPSSADLLADNPSAPTIFWNLGPDAEGSRWYHTDNPDPVNNHWGVGHTNDFVNEPDAYVGDRREFWDRGTVEGRWEPIDNSTRRTEVRSWAINLQSMFFNEHLIGNFGYREDRVKNWLNSVPPEKHDLAEAGILGPEYLGDRSYAIDPQYFKPEDGLYSEIDKGPTGTGSWGYGGVLHLPRNLGIARMPRWLGLSLHYNFSKNFIPDASRNTFIPGENWSFETLPSPIGEGRDIGFTVNLNDNKLIARFNWFRSTILNGSAGLGSTLNQLVFWAIRARGWAVQDLDIYDPDRNGVIDVDKDGNPHPRAGDPRWDVSRIYDVLEATQWAIDDGWIPAKEELGFLEWNANGTQKRQVWFPGLEDTEDRVSDGFELNLTWNATPNWRIAFNATHMESVSSNIGPLTSFVMQRFFDHYNKIKDYVLWEAADTNSTNFPVSRWLGKHVLTYYQKKLQEGSSTNEVRNWYANLVTNYSFREGRLKGFSVGGAVRYMSEGAIGYPLMDYEVSPGVSVKVPDVDNPWNGEAQWNVDVNVGYQRRILGDRVTWNCRLYLKNINNLSSDNLSPIRANFDGTPAMVRWDPPFTALLTNTFSF